MGLYTRYDEFTLRNNANKISRRKSKGKLRVQKGVFSIRDYIEFKCKR